jgi:hypothetical protein
MLGRRRQRTGSRAGSLTEHLIDITHGSCGLPRDSRRSRIQRWFRRVVSAQLELAAQQPCRCGRTSETALMI